MHFLDRHLKLKAIYDNDWVFTGRILVVFLRSTYLSDVCETVTENISV